jgi:hypothetical protein
MPDWQKLVRQRLSGLALDAAGKDEVHTELAAHLDDSYESLRSNGLPEQAAMQQTLLQVTDWKELQREIFLAKKGASLMQKRVYQLWIPGFLTLTLSTIFLMMLQKYGFRPRIVSWSGPGTVLFYLPWLFFLPLFGALGAYLSSRAGASRGAVLLASIFPAFTLAATFLFMLPVGLVIERVVGHQVDFNIFMTAFLMALIGWVLVPGAALLMGGLPMQYFLSRRSTPRETATS